LVNQADMERHAVAFAEIAKNHQKNQREKHRKEDSQLVAEVAADANLGEN